MTSNIPFHNNLTHEEYYRSMGVTCNCKMTTNQFVSLSGLSQHPERNLVMGYMTQKDVNRMNEMLRAEMKAAQPKRPRLIHEIARDIRLHWANVYYGAEPYLAAMETIYNIEDSYGLDSAESIVTYFLGNAGGFRGEHARRLKAELKALLTN